MHDVVEPYLAMSMLASHWHCGGGDYSIVCYLFYLPFIAAMAPPIILHSMLVTLSEAVQAMNHTLHTHGLQQKRLMHILGYGWDQRSASAVLVRASRCSLWTKHLGANAVLLLRMTLDCCDMVLLCTKVPVGVPGSQSGTGMPHCQPVIGWACSSLTWWIWLMSRTSEWLGTCVLNMIEETTLAKAKLKGLQTFWSNPGPSSVEIDA